MLPPARVVGAGHALTTWGPGLVAGGVTAWAATGDRSPRRRNPRRWAITVGAVVTLGVWGVQHARPLPPPRPPVLPAQRLLPAISPLPANRSATRLSSVGVSVWTRGS